MDALEVSINGKVRSILRNGDNRVMFVEVGYDLNWTRKRGETRFKVLIWGVSHQTNRFKRTVLDLDPTDIVSIKRISLTEIGRPKKLVKVKKGISE